jgi:paraquat-inducible protein B
MNKLAACQTCGLVQEVDEEYAPLVRMNSIFWNAGGINFHPGLFSGANIRS